MYNAVELGSYPSETFSHEVVRGLSQSQKTISSRWLYDERGSALFEEITQLAEYYPTRTEVSILSKHAREISDFCGEEPVLIEYGAGAAIKTEMLLAALRAAQLYVPVDIAGDFLEIAVARLRERFANLATHPIVADFTAPIHIPNWVPSENRVAFFPGSTLGNLDVVEARLFLQRIRQHVGPDGCALIGVDMKKPLTLLIPAYDDERGVTAEFNLNLLHRMNRELGANFKLDCFRHHVRWNSEESAVEMHLVSRRRQTVKAAQRRFDFEVGETIHTESSRKYDLLRFERLARRAGWTVSRHWTDPDALFSIFGLEPVYGECGAQAHRRS
jgi:dimethylhistidine N-methyltransferase